MNIPVMRVKRNKLIGDSKSPVLNYLKLVPGHAKSYTIKDVAAETEAMGGMSAEDVEHIMKSFIRSLKKILVRGDKVKIDGLGTFHVTFSCEGTENEKDCTVRSIRRVNIRFKVDNTLRLANDSTATTRGGANNVEFYIQGEATKAGAKPDNNPGGNGDGDDDFADPNA